MTVLLCSEIFKSKKHSLCLSNNCKYKCAEYYLFAQTKRAFSVCFSQFNRLIILWSSTHNLTPLLAWGWMHMESPACLFNCQWGASRIGGDSCWGSCYSPHIPHLHSSPNNLGGVDSSMTRTWSLIGFPPLNTASLCLLEYTTKLVVQLLGTEPGSLHGGQVFCSWATRASPQLYFIAVARILMTVYTLLALQLHK